MKPQTGDNVWIVLADGHDNPLTFQAVIDSVVREHGRDRYVVTYEYRGTKHSRVEDWVYPSEKEALEAYYHCGLVMGCDEPKQRGRVTLRYRMKE